MAKDPATLWYFNDWHGGTITFSRHLKGCYMDVLYAQFNIGRLSLDEIKTVLGSDFGSSWPTLQKKFKTENNLFFNERLEIELNKRKSFTKSRRENAKHKKHVLKHMENENENEIKIDNENLIDKYGIDMIEDFLRYWNEPDKKGKCKWELQETWSLEGRLVTWAKNNEKFNKKINGSTTKSDFGKDKNAASRAEVDRLADEILQQHFSNRPSDTKQQ